MCSNIVCLHLRLIPTTITGFSELKKRQKLQEHETLQHQKRLSVSCSPQYISNTVQFVLIYQKDYFFYPQVKIAKVYEKHYHSHARKQSIVSRIIPRDQGGFLLKQGGIKLKQMRGNLLNLYIRNISWWTFLGRILINVRRNKIKKCAWNFQTPVESRAF